VASKTLAINKDPDKKYRELEKAITKLFKKYPPGSGKSQAHYASNGEESEGADG
jgi:hypothetical protein